MIREVVREALSRPLQTLAEAVALAVTVLALLSATVILWACLK
jgi:hypothetical protein